MEVSVLFYLGGIYHIGWAIFDLFWPRFFNWKTTLAHLDDFNRAVLYISGRLLVLQRYFGIGSFSSRSLRFRCERYAA